MPLINHWFIIIKKLLSSQGSKTKYVFKLKRIHFKTLRPKVFHELNSLFDYFKFASIMKIKKPI